MTRTKIYPGMLDDKNIVLFVIENQLKAIQNGKIISFSDFSFPLIQILKDAMNADKKTVDALMQIHPNSDIKRIEQFAKCRFGGLYFTPDIENGVISEGDYWDCPIRNKCQYNKILCKAPSYKGKELTLIDLELMKLLSTTKTNEVIAEEIGVPYGSIHKLKKILYDKLEVQTKQEIAVIAVRMNFL